MRAVLSLLAALLLAPPAPPAPRILNLVPAFLAYEEACRDASPEVKAAKWDEMLEAKWPEFFRDAIYRALAGAEREKYEAACREEFFRDVAPRTKEIAARNEGMEERILGAVTDFRKAFPAFAPVGDYYVTISFSFRGKVVTVAGKEVLAIGLEKFAGDDGSQVLITLAHEMFHLCHLPGFPAGGGLYRSLWTEGLASYASAVVVPGRKMSALPRLHRREDEPMRGDAPEDGGGAPGEPRRERPPPEARVLRRGGQRPRRPAGGGVLRRVPDRQ